MRHTELFYLLALQKTEGIGDVNARKLISHFGSAEAIFTEKRPKLKKIDGIGSVTMQKLNDKTAFDKAEKELAFIENAAVRAITFYDDGYPEKLRHCYDAPLILFVSGDINLKDRKLISIVGTREITAYGRDFCRELVSEIAPLEPVIISGFAYGVDITAHLAALENNLQTVAVVAHGLNQIYPKQHKRYISKVLENGGFMTEFWSSSNPIRENFLQRNRIVAGISDATIVIESAEKGGSLVTAAVANDYSRDVFAVPGRTTDKYSQGCNNLIKTQKAQMLTSAADLIYMMNWDLQQPVKPVQKQLFVSLDSEEQSVYDFLHSNGRELLDIIALECRLPVYKMSGILFNMELKGVIRPLPGKLFEAI
ncbi:MAG: DNA-protecting protein DprA [Flavobacterium sp. BFFFF1]|uniref:DNA-processing protein DprA n=1 Tax=Flavobacterium sp. BFFFF1 TaxID=2015557 RepID=UPI000BD3415F|nr:DNA-processing protein DprA [Flavobacterium sp. BFFFF1]OYU80953.1 MAG: DNA-protecting protein DprA [Flavobacterium sp. BFFFF1]